jgi:2,4-dienoyl-CoA reductase-like NADH-dependent reductase (Old Yellow Enzyme family)
VEVEKAMNETRYKELFKPVSIGSMRLKNRIVMSPMHTKFANELGGVTDRLVSYHVERAKGGVGLIVIENTCVDWELGRATGNPVTIHDDLFRGGLSDLVEAVHRHGAKIVPELHHAGRQNVRANTVDHKQPIAPSAVQSKVGGDEPRAMNEEDIEKTIQQFVDGARRAKECGFDGLEFHGAHGYLLTQFLSPQTNRRNDKWGGTLENRARFALEIIRRTRAVVGPQFPLIYRMNVEDRTPDGLKLEEGVAFAVMLQNEGIDAIDVTAGI